MGSGFELSVEVVSAILTTICVVVVVLLALLFVRRRAIAHGNPLMLCAAREGRDRPWRERLLRLDTDGLALFTLGGVSLRADATFARRGLDLGTAEQMTDGLPEVLRRRSCVVVPLMSERGYQLEIVLAEGDYMALRSWQESMPPAPGQPNVF